MKQMQIFALSFICVTSDSNPINSHCCVLTMHVTQHVFCADRRCVLGGARYWSLLSEVHLCFPIELSRLWCPEHPVPSSPWSVFPCLRSFLLCVGFLSLPTCWNSPVKPTPIIGKPSSGVRSPEYVVVGAISCLSFEEGLGLVWEQLVWTRNTSLHQVHFLISTFSEDLILNDAVGMNHTYCSLCPLPYFLCWRQCRLL